MLLLLLLLFPLLLPCAESPPPEPLSATASPDWSEPPESEPEPSAGAPDSASESPAGAAASPCPSPPPATSFPEPEPSSPPLDPPPLFGVQPQSPSELIEREAEPLPEALGPEIGLLFLSSDAILSEAFAVPSEIFERTVIETAARPIARTTYSVVAAPDSSRTNSKPLPRAFFRSRGPFLPTIPFTPLCPQQREHSFTYR